MNDAGKWYTWKASRKSGHDVWETIRDTVLPSRVDKMKKGAQAKIIKQYKNAIAMLSAIGIIWRREN